MIRRMAGLADLPLPLSTTWAVLASLGATVSLDGEALVVSANLPGHRWCHGLSVLDVLTGDVDQS